MRRPGVLALRCQGVFFVDCESGSGAPCARGTFRWGSGLVAREGSLGLGLVSGGPCLACDGCLTLMWHGVELCCSGCGPGHSVQGVLCMC